MPGLLAKPVQQLGSQPSPTLKLRLHPAKNIHLSSLDINLLDFASCLGLLSRKTVAAIK